jgi:hypothetical protein
MPDTQIDLQQKTRAQISQGVSIAIMVAFGAAGAAALLLFGTSKKNTTTTYSTTTTASTTTTPTDLTSQTLPPTESTASVTAITTVLDPSVSVRITSPMEGATANGGTTVTVELTDPNHAAAAVRVRLYGDMLPANMQGMSIGGNDTTAPYTFAPNLVMYPSGEYRYVAEAVKFDSSIPGADTAVVIATSDTMVTWVRSCYYLGYQDFTVTAPTAAVTAGTTLDLTGTITNHVRGNCLHNYTINTLDNFGTSLLPAGWSEVATPTSTMSLGIEQSKPFTVKISVPAGTAAGTYSVGAKSQLDYTGFMVTKKVSVTVAAETGGTVGTEPGEIIPNR